MGVAGLETAFPMLYTRLVQTGALTLERLIALLHDAPMRRFGVGTELTDGAPADLTVFDLAHRCTIDRAFFVSGGTCSPFAGESSAGNLPHDYGWREYRMAIELNRKLVLEDGAEYLGTAFGSCAERVCEVVFNTSMVGYQEIVSDPSYTAPGGGNDLSR